MRVERVFSRVGECCLLLLLMIPDQPYSQAVT